MQIWVQIIFQGLGLAKRSVVAGKMIFQWQKSECREY